LILQLESWVKDSAFFPSKGVGEPTIVGPKQYKNVSKRVSSVLRPGDVLTHSLHLSSGSELP
jgi:hypothetical protein